MSAGVAICSICSREKDLSEELLPAHMRYKGSHVTLVARAAAHLEVPFYVLSGVYGLISGDHPIPYYDRMLVQKRVALLADIISQQLLRTGMKRLYFYTKRKPDWEPYLNALEIACRRAKVALIVHELDENA